MNVTRTFLGWHQPPLIAAAAALCESHRRNGAFNLTNAIAVVPGAMAGRILLERLVFYADEHRTALFPPRIITPSQLPECLYTQRRPFASPLVQQLAWSYSLRQHKQLERHFPQRPSEDDALGWLELGQQVADQFGSLVSEGKDFGDVFQAVSRQKTLGDQRRWKFLMEVQSTYLAQLASIQLADRGHARMDSVRRSACRTDRDILLIAVADLDGCLCDMVRQVGARVTTYIAAPDTLAAYFDELGCIVPSAWEETATSVRDDQITLVDGAREQVHEILWSFADWAPTCSIDQVCVSVPDPRLVRELKSQLLERGVATYWWIDKTVGETIPWRLLNLLSEYLQQPRFSDFASLLRHPDLEAWLRLDPVTSNHLWQADRYDSAHLPTQVGTWLGPASQRSELEPIHQRLESALAVMRLPAARLSTWSDRMAEFLTQIYGDRVVRNVNCDDADLDASLTAMADVLGEAKRMPGSLERPILGYQALQILLRQLEGKSIVGDIEPDSVEVVGWLDAPFTIAPRLILTSFNEGFVPHLAVRDPLLSESLRAELELVNDRRRYARDTYLFELILQTKQHVNVIVAKRDVQGYPRVPSRLILTGDGNTITKRCRRLFQEVAAVNSVTDYLAPDHAPPELSPNIVPLPKKRPESLAVMNVTSFRDYLNCPYRFYLKHVLKLEPCHDEFDELPPSLFGTMLHGVLERFGVSEIRTKDNSGEIAEYLRDTLMDLVYERFGPARSPAVDIQIRVMQHRLDAFADWQAKRVQSGWQIHLVEGSFGPEQHRLPLSNGQSMGLSGRIDRIDWRPETDEWEVLDYKTSDAGGSPQETHRKNGEWTDLQLPLYRFMVPQLGIPPEQMRLGYILLPKDTTKVGDCMADWTEDDFRSAHRVACEVAQSVYEQSFWPPAEEPKFDIPEYSVICRQRVPLPE